MEWFRQHIKSKCKNRMLSCATLTDIWMQIKNVQLIMSSPLLFTTADINPKLASPGTLGQMFIYRLLDSGKCISGLSGVVKSRGRDQRTISQSASRSRRAQEGKLKAAMKNKIMLGNNATLCVILFNELLLGALLYLVTLHGFPLFCPAN